MMKTLRSSPLKRSQASGTQVAFTDNEDKDQTLQNKQYILESTLSQYIS